MMTQELVPAESTEPQLQDKPIKYTLETLPELLPQQQLMLDAILSGDNYTDAYRKAGYKSQYAKQAALVLISRNPLKAHLDYFFSEMAKTITPEYIVNKLVLLTDRAMDVNSENPINTEIAIKAIQEINKMRGNYAQTITQVNNVHASLDDIRNAKNEYKSDK